MARDYAKEYRDYHSRPEQRRNRSNRNKARRLMIKQRGKGAVDGHDIDHVDGNPMNNSLENLKITTVKYNRGKH
jgi:hypothetical protein